MKLILVLLMVGALVAQEPTPPPEPTPEHHPEACARTQDFDKEGNLIHACACHRMGQTDGEDCVPIQEDRACKAWCRPDLCRCPVACDIEGAR